MSEDQADHRRPGSGPEDPGAECSECAELMELIAEYLDDRETVEMRRALMAHATACDRCARLLWSMRRLVATCRAETGSEVPGEAHAALWQALVAEFRIEGGRAEYDDR